MAGRRFTRPRTRMYDCNYSLGESYYKPALDTLDRKYGGGIKETIEAPKRSERPLSMGSIEGLLDERRPEMDALNAQMEEDMESMTRMHRARARHQTSTEENFENAFLNRREEVKRRFSEKMLDTVGINGSAHADEDNTISLRRRALRMVAETEEDAPKVCKWSAMQRDPLEQTMEDIAAKTRARASRARLADLESEMEEMAERGAARERRLTGLRQLLGAESELSDASAIRLKKTVTITEKRLA